jgi:hypothetical protein
MRDHRSAREPFRNANRVTNVVSPRCQRDGEIGHDGIRVYGTGTARVRIRGVRVYGTGFFRTRTVRTYTYPADSPDLHSDAVQRPLNSRTSPFD